VPHDINRISLLDLTLPTAEENLALDEALLIEADAGRGGPVLRFWEATGFAVVLGASRRLRDDVLIDACQADAVPILRRSSGGGTVMIGPGALNVTVILPSSAAPGLAAVDVAQRFVLDRIAESLSSADQRVELLGSGDLTCGGRKFSGSAQRRLSRWFFVHLSLLYDFPIPRISRYLTIPNRQPGYRAGRGHEEFLRNFGAPRRIIQDRIHLAWSPAHTLSPAIDVPHELVKTLLSDRFANRSWIERL
jgi:lipoate-protein ligase A